MFVLNWMTRQKPFLWKIVILAASLVFYGWWNWRFVFLLGTSIIINWLSAKKIRDESEKLEKLLARRWMQTAVIANLSLLGVYKYYDFFVLEISNRLKQVGFDTGLPLLDLTLPIGISFFTFQAISYVIDVGREDIEPLPLLDFAVYLSFFPQLVAGPIVRASEMAPQMSARSDPRYLQS
ncbi:MAG: MBOAT family O-acyltransferase, partial [Acidimicrobiales bacterium]